MHNKIAIPVAPPEQLNGILEGCDHTVLISQMGTKFLDIDLTFQILTELYNSEFVWQDISRYGVWITYHSDNVTTRFVVVYEVHTETFWICFRDIEDYMIFKLRFM